MDMLRATPRHFCYSQVKNYDKQKYTWQKGRDIDSCLVKLPAHAKIIFQTLIDFAHYFGRDLAMCQCHCTRKIFILFSYFWRVAADMIA